MQVANINGTDNKTCGGGIILILFYMYMRNTS